MNTHLPMHYSFSESVSVFSREWMECFVYIQQYGENPEIYTKKLYSHLISTSHLLEDFLDFHGAKNNKRWFFYRELTATARHLSLAGYSQRHITYRLPFYLLGDTEEFEKEGEATQNFITSCLTQMSPVILEEAKKLGVLIPQKKPEYECFPQITTGEILDFDIDDQSMLQQKKNIVKIASEFLSIAKNFEPFAVYSAHSFNEIVKIVPEKINEVEIRRCEMVVHNLQSSFDSYVIHGGMRFGNEKLRKLRGLFSVVLHLFQIMGRLLHFYERHIHNIGFKNIQGQVRDSLSSFVDKERLLDRTINYGLLYASRFLSLGKKLAREILNENIERDIITVGIPVQRGFHMRPSLLVAKIVEHYGGEVVLRVGGDSFDASSVLDIQWAGGKIQKENITEVTFEGYERALRDIAILASVNYGEDIMGKGIPLPRELNYLR